MDKKLGRTTMTSVKADTIRLRFVQRYIRHSGGTLAEEFGDLLKALELRAKQDPEFMESVRAEVAELQTMVSN